MNKPFRATVAFMLLGATIHNISALHSDALSDWNEVMQTHDDPFESFHESTDIHEETYVFDDYFSRTQENVKKRKRSSEHEIVDNQEYELKHDPRTQFNSQKIIEAYTSYATDLGNEKKVIFKCICSPLRTYTINSLSGFERHFTCTTHQRYMSKKLTPLIAHDAQEYITKHTEKPFIINRVNKSAYEIALQFVKKNKNGLPFFDFNQAHELEKIELALKPIELTCICDLKNSFVIHSKNAVLKHFKSDKHSRFKNEFINTSAQLHDDQAQAIILQHETDLFELATDSFKKRGEKGKYECPCGASLTIDGTNILREHFRTKKHKTNIKNTKMELKNRGVIL